MVAFSLENKVAIVTGSAGDIGKAMVKGLKKAGAQVYGFDIKTGMDITKAYMPYYIKLIYNKYRRIDILINNAGVGGKKLKTDFEHYPEKIWDKMLEVNLKTPFKLSQDVVKYMKRTGGSIINITSIWSERGAPGNIAYGASKGGLKQITKCMAYELAKYKIRVNNLGFGYIKSGMTQKSWDNITRRKFIANKTMLGRWGFPKDVVGAVIFLASDASSYITGQDIYIDGGFLSKGW